MMKYLNLSLVFMVIFGYGAPYASIALVSIGLLFATTYYYLSFQLFAGLRVSHIVAKAKEELKSSTLSVFINILVATTLFIKTPYEYVALFLAPWLCITLCTMLLSWLVYAEIIEIKSIDKK